MREPKRIIDIRDLFNCYAIELTQGCWALVSPCDIERVRLYIWSVTHERRYAQANRVDRYPVLLHRYILNFPDIEIDHINGNGLDCRRENLRIASHRQNSFNTKRRTDNTSGYKGVSFDKRRDRYYGYIGCKPRHFLGYFLTPEEAARAYDIKARELFGEFARLNFLQH